MKTLLPIACLATLFAASALADEKDATQTLTPAEVGPYRPEKTADLSKASEQIVQLTNQFRREDKRTSVSVDEKLQRTAQKFADYMASTDRYGHTADGRQPAERATDQKYDYCAIEENIAYQFKTTGFDTDDLAKQFFEGWKNSPGHRANMLRPYNTQTGVAIAQSKRTGVYYAVQMFGRPKSESIQFRVANETGEAVSYQLGEQIYPLLPRVIRTHTVCQPYELKLIHPEQDGQVIARVEPKNGERFAVRASGSVWKLEKAPADSD